MTFVEFLPVLGYLSGAGGIVTMVVTFQSRKRQAVAQARGAELDNIEEAVKIWRELAASFKTDNEKLSKDVEALRKEVIKLYNINNRIVKILDQITPENLEKKVQEIKAQLHETT